MSTGCQKDRNIERQTDRPTDRKTKRLFSLVIRTKVVKNVNRKIVQDPVRTAKEPALVYSPCTCALDGQQTWLRGGQTGLVSDNTIEMSASFW